MKFDAYAALAKLREEAGGGAKRAKRANLPAPFSTISTFSTGQAVKAETASPPAEVLPFAPPPDALEPSRDTGDPFRHGRSGTGQPLTWTGRVVSLDEWRGLSVWDRHGPDGRTFCGICRAWVPPGGGCSAPGCRKGGAS